MRFSGVLLTGALALVTLHTTIPLHAAPRHTRDEFEIEETTIARVHAAMIAGTLTCRALVDDYLARIAAYDRKGPALDALVVVNPHARDEADALDRRFAVNGLTGPLHCVPVIVKDNFETVGLQSAAGSVALRGFVSNKDATVVRRMKDAGAIVLAKSNMAEFGINSLTTVSSILGTTKNPYALDRVPAGSSGGTAAAIAANFGLVGLGTDTGSSIRGPAAHTALVGLRPTMGLTSRAGTIPLNYLSDVTGPITRTVEDAASVLQVIAGEDPDDPATAAGHARTLSDYHASLAGDGLRGARIGVLAQAFDGDPVKMDDEIARLFTRALDDMQESGAEVVRVDDIAQVSDVRGANQCRGLAYDLDEYLAKQGDRVRVHSLQEILDSGEYLPSIQLNLLDAVNADEQGPGSKACRANAEYRSAVAQSLTAAMDSHGVDVLVYPTWSQPPEAVKSINPSKSGEPIMFATVTGFPAITVPMGFTHGVLPAGVSFLGRAWSEPTLLRLAYSYEQATEHRRPPGTTPPLP